MHILVLSSQKGGTVKTTLSGHLAVEAQNAGVGPVALIDTDPQGSLSHWWNARTASEPLFVKVGPFELGKALEHLARSGVKLAVIDTPPAITESISNVIGHADLVVLPTRPSPHDLRAVGPTVDIANRLDKPVLFVVNAATPRARITGEAAVALSQHGTVAPITIHHRVDFAASMVPRRPSLYLSRHRRARRWSHATTSPFVLNRGNPTTPRSCVASSFPSRGKNWSGSTSLQSRRAPTATRSYAARSTIIFASSRRSSRTAPA